MKKNYLAVLLVTVMMTLTACGDKETENTESAAEETTEGITGEAAASDYDPVLYEDLKSKLITLGEYKGLEGTYVMEAVTDEQVQEQIRTMKKSFSELVDVDRAAELGDAVVIDYTGYVDGETSDSLQGTEFLLELGSGQFVAGFEEQLIGASAGEDVEVNITFPDTYYEEMAGKDARFEVYVHKVQVYEVEGWGDDFIKENLGYENEAAMTESIRQELEATAESVAQANLEYELIQIFLEQCEFEIQDADVEAYIDEMMMEYVIPAEQMGMELDQFLQSYIGVTEAQLREIYRDPALFRVEMTVSFHEIAEKEGLEVTDEEYQEELESLAAQYGYGDVSEVESVYSPEMLREQLIQNKAIRLIRENAVIQ